MIGQEPVRDEDLHAYIDGELPAAQAARVAGALRADPALAARVAAYAADKAALKAAFRPELDAPLPAAWIARIEHSAQPPPRRAVGRRTAWAMALAACVTLAVGGAYLLLRPAEDPILAQAQAAWQAHSAPVERLEGAALADATARDALLAQAVGLKLGAPDLARLGWKLTEIDAYASAAALRYRAGDGRALMVFVRKGNGTTRFEMLRNGGVPTCIWQGEEVAAVMMGDISAGRLGRAAIAAYDALDL